MESSDGFHDKYDDDDDSDVSFQTNDNDTFLEYSYFSIKRTPASDFDDHKTEDEFEF